MESYMAGPISVKLSGIDEGHSAQHLEPLAGGAREIEKQNEMCGAAQIKNESRSKENLS